MSGLPLHILKVRGILAGLSLWYFGVATMQTRLGAACLGLRG